MPGIKWCRLRCKKRKWCCLGVCGGMYCNFSFFCFDMPHLEADQAGNLLNLSQAFEEKFRRREAAHGPSEVGYIAYTNCHCKVSRKNRWWTARIRSLLPRAKSQRFSNLIGVRLDCIWLPTCLQNISQLILSSQARRCWLVNTFYNCEICTIIVWFKIAEWFFA